MTREVTNPRANGLVLAPDDRVQRDGGADAGDGDDHVDEGAPAQAGRSVPELTM